MASADTSKARVGYLSHAVTSSDLQPADHIYCYRALATYSHHGIYIGKADCEVIHFSVGDDGNLKSAALIRKCTIKEFQDGSELRLVAYGTSTATKVCKRAESCHTYKADPPSKVIERAERYLRNPTLFGEYNLLTNNSEHFAFYCKTGETINVAGQGPLRYVSLVQHMTDVLEEFF